MGLEQELKYFLSKKDYETLFHALKPQIRKTVHHTNFYFDDPKLHLRKKRFGLRLRFLDEKRAVITLKHPAKVKTPKVPSLKVRHEYEEDISCQVADHIIAGRLHVTQLRILPIKVLKSFFSKGTLEGISPLGRVDTIRSFVQHTKGLELELDCFEMFRRKFYELEIETLKPKRADESIRALFKEHRIPYHPFNKSKLGRFIQEWQRRHSKY